MKAISICLKCPGSATNGGIFIGPTVSSKMCLPIHTISPFILNPLPFKAWMEAMAATCADEFSVSRCLRVLRVTVSGGGASQTMKCEPHS